MSENTIKRGRISSFLSHPLFVGIYLSGVFFFAFYYLYEKRQSGGILQSLERPNLLILGSCIIAIKFFLRVFLCQKIYQALGVTVSYPKMLQILSISKMGRYVPGKIWFVSSYYVLSRKLGIASQIIAQNYFIANVLIMVYALICCIPGVFFLSLPVKVSKIGLLFMIVIFLCIIHPKVLSLLFQFAEAAFAKFKGEDRFEHMASSVTIPVRALTVLSVGFLVFWLFSGVILYLVVFAFRAVSFDQYPIYLSTIAMANIIGLLAVFAPGGIGVQESISVVILSPMITSEIAIMVVVVLRILFVVNDILFASLGLLVHKIFKNVDSGV